jgi:hypothetical protein
LVIEAKFKELILLKVLFFLSLFAPAINYPEGGFGSIRKKRWKNTQKKSEPVIIYATYPETKN